VSTSEIGFQSQSTPRPDRFEQQFNPPLVMPAAGYYMFTIGNGVLAVHGPSRGVEDRGDLVATYHLGEDGWHLVVEVPEHPGDPTP
jgi:hypothetical protein